jgi:Dual specificity phosphatase, catalytic domain
VEYNYDRILGSIYVGGYENAGDFNGFVLFVHHDIQWYTKGLHIPLLSKKPNSPTDRTGAKINYSNLYLITETIDRHFKNHTPLLVHCRGGVERSPLCVVHWLVEYFDNTPDIAYDYVKMKRPVVEDRRYWLNG